MTENQTDCCGIITSPSPEDEDHGEICEKFPIQETQPPGSYSLHCGQFRERDEAVFSDGGATTADGSCRRHFRHAQGGGDVECNGTTNGGSRDAPGQSCSYIISGDHRVEVYRLATDYRYPENVPVKCGDLAASGHYYTGYKDRVKCFSCGMAVENWMMGDDGMDNQWHRTDCPMMNGKEYGNEPIETPNFRTLLREYKGFGNLPFRGQVAETPNQAQAATGSSRDATDVTANMSQVRLSETTYPKLILANVVVLEHERNLRRANLKSELERRNTFDKWPSYPAPYLVNDLAKEGFFYLGNLDRTQCFSCSGVLRNWAPSDSVREQHQKHFPNCRFLSGEDARNVEMAEDQRRQEESKYRRSISALMPNENTSEPPDLPVEEQHHLESYLRCKTPINKQMETLQNRIDSFAEWPKYHTRASVEQIAKAGFFYLGMTDRTKCFYCNGGLRQWDFYDEPWMEHAKWFPECEFVLRTKGPVFVSNLKNMHPNLDRPRIQNPVCLHAIPPFEERRSANQDGNLPAKPPSGVRAQSRTVEATEHRLHSLEPGQLSENCYYVLPGDKRSELGRLGMFGLSAQSSPLCAKRNAASGFVRTGYRNRTECVSCGAYGQCGEDTSHLPNCATNDGEDVRNRPAKPSEFAELMVTVRKKCRLETTHHDLLVNSNSPARCRAWSSSNSISQQDEDC